MLKQKDQLKRFIISQPTLEWLTFQLLKWKGRARAQKESERRKKISIFDYQALSADIPYSPEERVIDNNLYGYAHHLKKYAGLKTDLKAYLEHGFFWGGMVHKDQRFWHFKKIITLSNYRKSDILKHLPSKTVIPVGPYVHYAEEIYSEEEKKNWKQTLGKTLLVFPYHSAKNISAEFDHNDFLNEIKRVAKNYDSVLISMYFIDAQNKERVALYEREGFKVVTSGHKYDHYFVSRQKTLIELSDMTMSNEPGTQVGYCVFLQKPHYLFQQEVYQKGATDQDLKRIKSVTNTAEKKIIAAQKGALVEVFKDLTPTITKEQYDLCNKYWGFDSAKSPEELRRLLQG